MTSKEVTFERCFFNANQIDPEQEAGISKEDYLSNCKGARTHEKIEPKSISILKNEMRYDIRKVRKKFLRYKEAEVVYSIQHKKLLELMGLAGAIYRIDGYVLIDREVFDHYLEQFREPATPPDRAHSVRRKKAGI